MHNITGNKMLEENTLRCLEGGQIGTWTWFAKSDKLIWDDIMFDLFNINKSDFLGNYESFNNLIHEDDRERVLSEVNKSIINNTQFKTRFRIKLENGDVKWIAGRGKLNKDSLGNADVMSGINYDITEQVHLEENLKSKNKELENFAYLVSHDLREPLRSINGFSQMLSSKYGKCLDEKGKNYISFIIEGTKKLDFIIKNILDQCRLENKDFEKEELSVDVVLEKVVKSLSFSVVNAKIYKENLHNIYMNEIHLHQILQNLISNGIKYSKEGTIPEINVFMQDNEKETMICVQDNGIGISQENKEKLFEIFKRIKTGKEGNGIGLALCKKIVDLYEGKIWIESELGVGSTFCVSIPKKI